MLFKSPEEAKTFLLEMFNLVPPITEAELKRAFRQKVLEVHPDHAGDNGDAFIIVKEAYDALLVYPELFGTEGSETSFGATTVCGTFLSTLGKGLGMPEANTRCCDKCYGRGWTQKKVENYRFVWDFPTCFLCFGTGHTWGGVCYGCGGDGKFKKHGKRRIKVNIGATVHQPRKCGPCNGAGETRLANPVITPGSLLLR